MNGLETQRLKLRPWQDSDRAAFAAINADPRVMRFFPNVWTREESDQAIDRITAHIERHGFGFYAAELKATGEVLGFIGLNVPRWTAHFTPCVEVGWRLSADHWRKGLATEGARAALEEGFRWLGLDEIVAITAVKNEPSRGVMEKLGMVYDAAGDFDHPLIAPESPVVRHVLYRLPREAGRAQN